MKEFCRGGASLRPQNNCNIGQTQSLTLQRDCGLQAELPFNPYLLHYVLYVAGASLLYYDHPVSFAATPPRRGICIGSYLGPPIFTKCVRKGDRLGRPLVYFIHRANKMV